MSVVRIPPVLRQATGGEREIQVSGATVSEVLADLYAKHPGVRAQLQTDDGELHRFVNVYLNEEDVRLLSWLDTEVADGDTPAGEIRVWLWSPDAPAMDLRRYDDTPHGLPVSYEDWKPGWGTPLGIANTHELTLRAFAAIPSNAELQALARAAGAPPVLVATPQYYHSVQALGRWSLPDRSTPTLAWVAITLCAVAAVAAAAPARRAVRVDPLVALNRR